MFLKFIFITIFFAMFFLGCSTHKSELKKTPCEVNRTSDSSPQVFLAELKNIKKNAFGNEIADCITY